VDNFVVNPPFRSTTSSGAFNHQTKFKRNLYFSFMKQQIKTNFRAGKTALQKWATIKAQIAHDIVSRI
jgi:hypothetical protein